MALKTFNEWRIKSERALFMAPLRRAALLLSQKICELTAARAGIEITFGETAVPPAESEYPRIEWVKIDKLSAAATRIAAGKVEREPDCAKGSFAVSRRL